MLYWSSNPNYTITVTVWSIRRERAKNEKQGPTTTEMTAKLVKSVHEWCYRCCRHSAVLFFQSKLYHCRHRLIYTERTSQEREAGANYNRNDSQISEISELESWMMLQMLSTLCCTDRPIQLYHHRHRLIYTERTSQEREAEANYNRNDSQISEISELESWMMLQMLDRKSVV